MDDVQAMSILRARGIAKVSVPFEGGNDEGFSFDADLYDAGNEKVGTLKEWVPIDRPETEDEELYEFLAAPIFERYGSFAGDYQVMGSCVWTVETGSVEIRGQEQVWQDI